MAAKGIAERRGLKIMTIVVPGSMLTGTGLEYGIMIVKSFVF
jgi:hypothetical protein